MDLTVKLWDISVGTCLKTLHDHDKGVLSVVFNHQENTLISSGEDETIKIWDVETGKCIKSLSSKKPYEGMKLNGIMGLSQATIASLKD